MEKQKSVKIDESLHNQLKQYCSLPNTPKIKEVVETLIRNFIADKTLSNDFILLENPFYLNTTSLLQDKHFNCVKKLELVGDLNNCFIIKKIPNNLDTWNDIYQTYCFEEKRTHKGVLPYLALLDRNGDEEIKLIYHIFYYNDASDDLQISIIGKKDLLKILSPFDDKELIESFLGLEKALSEDIEKGELSFSKLVLKYNDDSIMNNFTSENATALISQFGETFSDVLIDPSVILEDISKMTKQLSEDGQVDFNEIVNLPDEFTPILSKFMDNFNTMFNGIINFMENEKELINMNDFISNLDNPDLYEKFSIMLNCDDDEIVDLTSDFMEELAKSLWDYYKNHTESNLDNVHKAISNLDNMPFFKEIEEMIYTCDTQEEFLEKVRSKAEKIISCEL